MFKGSIRTSALRSSIDALLAVVDEARFNLTPTGVSVRAVDAANVAMVSLELPDSAFDAYSVDKEVTIGLDLSKFIDLLKMGNPDSICEMDLQDSSRLKIKMGSLKYSISLLEPSTIKREPKIPEIELPGEVILRGSDFRQGIKASEPIGDYLVVGIETKPKEIFIMETEGDVDRVTLELDKDDLFSISVVGEDAVRSMFSIEYLKEISKVTSAADEVKLKIGKDFPIDISFAVGDASVRYLLAPRIEAD
ncbi:MAG: proliferating cell nuclear antigen (pcna) [Candidatus Syntrophoarchaeum sp.]|nr:proliferating cell nuclear antigen (pcna) [Candidatus Syntrophoarchaeum sp.]